MVKETVPPTRSRGPMCILSSCAVPAAVTHVHAQLLRDVWEGP